MKGGWELPVAGSAFIWHHSFDVSEEDRGIRFGIPTVWGRNQ